MVLTLLTLIAAVLDTILATIVWSRFRGTRAARAFIAIMAIRIVFAVSHHVLLPAAQSPGEVAAIACLRWALLPAASLAQLLFFLSIYEDLWLTPARVRAIAAAYALLGAALVADVAWRVAPLFGAPGPLGDIDPFALGPHAPLLALFTLTWLPGLFVLARTMWRAPVERLPLALVLTTSIAGVALGAVASRLGDIGNGAILFDVLVTFSLAYLLLRRRVFETTRLAIDDALASMAEGIAVLGADGRVLFANPAIEAQLRLRAGVTVEALEIRDPPVAAMVRELDGERSLFRIELSDREILLASSPILDEDHTLTGHLLLAQDVTEEEQARRARDRAEAASAAKSAFLAHMSHELRTPLHAILGFAQLLANDRSLGPEAKDHVALIERSGNHLLELINGVLDLSRIEAGKLALVDARFAPARVLADILAMFRETAREKGLAFAVDTGAELPRAVRGDEGKLRQILINLVANALKFTEQGHVVVRASTARASSPDLESQFAAGATCRLRFDVEDTGPGIPESALARLFRPFATTGAPASGPSTGLGLAISRELARALGGDVHVKSAPGEGSTFSFDAVLALADPDPDEAESAAVVSLLQAPTNRLSTPFPPPNDKQYSEAIQTLPDPVRERLRRAAESLSPRESRAAIAELGPAHPELAMRLEDLVRAYRFDRILSLIDPGGPP